MPVMAVAARAGAVTSVTAACTVEAAAPLTLFHCVVAGHVGFSLWFVGQIIGRIND